MEQDEKYSILDELAKCSGYDIALMTTFNFEIGFFERAVLNRFMVKDVKTVSLYVDSREFTNALNEFDAKNVGSHLGVKYMVNPVRINGSFHPKVILLLGEKKARLYVGSANIKTSGYATNNEVFNFVDYDENHSEYLDVIVNAIDFFCAINESTYKLDESVLKAAKEYIYYHKAPRNDEVCLLHNMQNSIINQVEEIIADEVQSISIAVPYYDKELLALQELKDKFPKAHVTLYIQNNNSTFPVEVNKNKGIVDDINLFNRFKDNNTSSSGNFYHGKVFLFKTNNQAFALYGSANCTLSALTNTPSAGGNVECDLLEKGEISEFDYFFDNMEIVTDEKFVSQNLVFDAPHPFVFSFKYGEMKKCVELHIGYSRLVEGLKIKLEDKELEYRKSDEEIVVFVDEEFQDLLTDIFEITLTFEGNEERLRCWTYNPVVLLSNREIQNKSENFSDFEIDSTGDKYIEDRIRFLKAEATCFNELQEYKNNLKYINQIKMEQEEEHDESESFVVDYQIPDEYRYAYRQYNEVSKIRKVFVGRFLDYAYASSFENVKLLESHTSSKCLQSLAGDNTQFCISRKATSEEIAFERFIKGKVKGMLNNVYVEAIEFEHYVGLVQIVLDIFDKYSNKENVEDIFLPDYVLETKINFMRKIVGKSLENISDKEEWQKVIIFKSLCTIIENYIYYRNLSNFDDRWDHESANKSLLYELEQKYHLRQSYQSVMKDVIVGYERFAELSYEEACKYIEHLYGYKTLEMLSQFVSQIYPGADVTQKDDSIRIIVETDCILDCERLDANILKEISDYSRHVSKIHMVYFDFINIAPNPQNKNVINTIKHSINMEYHQWKHAEIRVNGDRHDTKSQYLSF